MSQTPVSIITQQKGQGSFLLFFFFCYYCVEAYGPILHITVVETKGPPNTGPPTYAEKELAREGVPIN